LNTRAAAASVLRSLGADGKGYENATTQLAGRLCFSQADRDYLYQLVKGVIQHRTLLDYAIRLGIGQGIDRTDSRALHLLRLGAFQRYLLNTPDYAMVNETVTAARELGGSRLAAFLNQALRKLPPESVWQQQLTQLPAVERLAIQYSHPQWLVVRWVTRWGQEATGQLLQFNNTYQTITFRHNPLRCRWEDAAERIASVAGPPLIIATRPLTFYIVPQPGLLLQSDLFRQGYCSVQDFSQALVVGLLDPQPGETIIDACAAPGGKSTAIAQSAGRTTRIYATDLEESRTNLIRNECRRLSIDWMTIATADAATAAYPIADRILLDAPCSGTGILGRRADLRWNRRPEDLPHYPPKQLKMLGNMSRFVRPGGQLIYSTCTLEEEENWGVVRQFLDGHPEFRLIPADQRIASRWCDTLGAMVIWPHVHHLPGAFAVCLEHLN